MDELLIKKVIDVSIKLIPIMQVMAMFKMIELSIENKERD